MIRYACFHALLVLTCLSYGLCDDLLVRDCHLTAAPLPSAYVTGDSSVIVAEVVARDRSYYQPLRNSNSAQQISIFMIEVKETVTLPLDESIEHPNVGDRISLVVRGGNLPIVDGSSNYIGVVEADAPRILVGSRYLLHIEKLPSDFSVMYDGLEGKAIPDPSSSSAYFLSGGVFSAFMIDSGTVKPALYSEEVVPLSLQCGSEWSFLNGETFLGQTEVSVKTKLTSVSERYRTLKQEHSNQKPMNKVEEPTLQGKVPETY